MGKLGNKKLIISLKGGLGNQMFQYAFTCVISNKNNSKIYIDKSNYNNSGENNNYTVRFFELDIFALDYNEALKFNINYFKKISFWNSNKKNLKLSYPFIFKEPSFDFNSNALLIKPPAYIKGYFQSYKYFLGYESIIKNIFSFPIHKLNTESERVLTQIKNSNSVSVHIRRGDYVNDKCINKVHGVCSLNYYLDAIKLITSRNKDFELIFFSDDIFWVKEHFNNLPFKKVFVDNNNNNNNNENSWQDMCLMSFCKHNIIANSSFSWWGAWLNQNKNKTIIAPKQWFFDTKLENETGNLIPKEWIRI